MWRLWWRNFSVASATLGKFVSAASALAAAGSVVQRLDQSVRTITTEPAGIRPWARSHALTSGTVRKSFGSCLTFGTVLITTSGRTVRRRVELGAELIGRDRVGGRLEAVLGVGVRQPGRRVDRGAERGRAEALPDRHVGRDRVCQ